MAKKRERKSPGGAAAAGRKPAPPAGPSEGKVRRSALFHPALLLGLQVGLFAGWNVYRGNQAEFDHGLLDLLPFLLPAAAAVTAVFWLLPRLLPGRFHLRAVSLLTMLGLLMYLQGNLLVWDYGVFDGGRVPWARHLAKGWLELALWTGALALSVIRPEKLFRHARSVCLVLIGLQCATLLVTSVGGEDGFWRRDGSTADMPPAGIYEYSRDRNVIHIVMDAFQTDVFSELAEQEGLGDRLDGFILFGDNLGVAAHTSFAIPAVFAGEIYDGRESPSTYYGRCINELGFPNRLHDEGWRVSLLPRLRMNRSGHDLHFRVPDTFGGGRGYRQRQAAGRLLDAGLFRQVPHFAKMWVHNEGQGRVSGLISTPPAHRSIHQRAFLDDYIARIEPVLAEPAYHFIHVMSPHPPYGVTADGSPSDGPMPLNRESYKFEARQCLRVFMDLLDRLRETGLYDGSLIILQGDHGIDFPPVVDGRPVDLPVRRAPTLLAIKAPGAAGPLETSRAPSSISDIPATVMDALGMEAVYPGRSLLDAAAGAERTRGFFEYLSQGRDQPALRRFVVSGPVYDPASWSEPELVPVVQDAADYTWGHFVEFGMEGDADPFTGRGWSAPLANSQWTDGKRAHLRFQVPAPGENVELLFALKPFLAPGKLDRQRLRILVNDRELKVLELTDQLANRYMLTIPGFFLQTDEIRITFDLPDAAVPAELGAGADRRMLGVSVLTVCMFPQSMTAEILEKMTTPPSAGDGR